MADALRIRSMAFSSSRQIPDRRVVADQFPVVALLKEFPLLRLYLGKLPADGLVLVVLRPHLPALSENSDPALGLDDLSPQVIVAGIHVGNFFMELLHGLHNIDCYYLMMLTQQRSQGKPNISSCCQVRNKKFSIFFSDEERHHPQKWAKK